MAVKEPLRNKENCLFPNEEKNMKSKMLLKWFSVQTTKIEMILLQAAKQ